MTNRYQQHLPCVVETAIIYYVFSHSSMFFSQFFDLLLFSGKRWLKANRCSSKVSNGGKNLSFFQAFYTFTIFSLSIFLIRLTRVIY